MNHIPPKNVKLPILKFTYGFLLPCETSALYHQWSKSEIPKLCAKLHIPRIGCVHRNRVKVLALCSAPLSHFIHITEKYNSFTYLLFLTKVH